MKNIPQRAAHIDIEEADAKGRLALIMALMWPALGENMLATLVSMADTMMVSGIGSHAIAAVGLVTQPRFIVFSAFMALGVGTTALVARAKGKRDPEEANTALRQSILLALGIVAVISALMFVFAEPLIRFIAGDAISEDTIQAALEYYRIQIYGFPVLGVTFIMNGALRGVGNTRAAFYSNGVANIVNVCLNYLLIGGKLGFPRLGVTGASLATVIGQTVAFGMCLYWLYSGKQYIRLRPRDSFKPDFPMIRRIANIGLPALIEQVIMRAGMMAFTLIATSLGDQPYASHVIAMNIQSLSFTTGNSFATAATTLTGQTLGRKRPDLSREYLKQTQGVGLIFSAAVSLFLFFLGGMVAGWYSKDAEIIRMSAFVLKIIAVANPISNARFIYTASLRGAGDSRYTARITFIGILVARPVIAYLLVFVFHLGLTGVWIALISDSMLCFVLAYLRWRTGKWALLKV